MKNSFYSLSELLVSARATGKDREPENLQEDLDNFIVVTVDKLNLLKKLLKDRRLDEFYQALLELKFLDEYSNELSRYWYLMRGYSGALSKLGADKTVKGAKRLYSYYFGKYGDRRIIRNEHWFEKKRWEFLDELQEVFNEYELEIFDYKYTLLLDEALKTYVSFFKHFISELRKLERKEKLVRLARKTTIHKT